MAVTHKTYCHHCTSLCGMEIDVEENRVLRVRGDKDHPVSKGYSCAMGQHSMHAQTDPKRLTTAQAKQADGSFKPIATDEALDAVAAKMKQLLDEHGPRSVAIYYGTGAAYNGLAYNIASSFLRAIESPERYTSMTVDQSSLYVCRDRMGSFKTGRPHFDDLDTIMLVGNNVFVSHQGDARSSVPGTNPRKAIVEARARGAKLIVIDPRHTETAEHADLFLQLKPGTDCTLLSAIIRVILKEGWQNKEFCERFVDTIPELAKAVEPFTPEYAAKITGVDADKIITAAKWFATVKRANAGLGSGACFGPNSNLAEHLVESLNALVGGYKRAGDPMRSFGLFNLNEPVEGIMPAFRTWDMKGPKMRSNPDIGQIWGEFPTSQLPNEILYEGEDHIRALIVFGGNPLTAIGDTAKTIKAFESLELMVSIDPRFSPTGMMADYIIPTTLPLEREDMNLILDSQRIISWADYTRPVLTPPEGMLDDWEVFYELCKRMGKPINFRTGPWSAQLGKGIDLDMNNRPSTSDLYRYACEVAGIDYDELSQHSGGMLLDRPEQIIQPAPEDDKTKLILCADDVAEEIAEVYRKGDTSNPDFPYLLISRRVKRVMNAMYHNFDAVKDKYSVAPLYMHPADIHAENLEPGEMVSIQSSVGKIVGELVSDDSLQRGVVSMPMGWVGADPEDYTSTLTSRLVSIDDNIELYTGMPQQTAIPVTINA